MVNREQVLLASITTRKRVWLAYIGLVATLLLSSCLYDGYITQVVLGLLPLTIFCTLFSVGALIITHNYKRDRQSPHWNYWSHRRPRFWMPFVIREEI